MVMAKTDTTSAHLILASWLLGIFSYAAFMVSKCEFINLRGFGTEVMEVVEALINVVRVSRALTHKSFWSSDNLVTQSSSSSFSCLSSSLRSSSAFFFSSSSLVNFFLGSSLLELGTTASSDLGAIFIFVYKLYLL